VEYRNCLFALAGLACGSAGIVDPALEAGPTYHYLATSPGGVPLLEGTLTIHLAPENVVTGTWDIHRVDPNSTVQVGPQVGTGNLIGSRSGDTLLIQLNPDLVDNNVGLVAVPTRRGWRGEWGFDAIDGPRSRGYFTANSE
jgi:hypothetical protein